MISDDIIPIVVSYLFDEVPEKNDLLPKDLQLAAKEILSSEKPPSIGEARYLLKIAKFHNKERRCHLMDESDFWHAVYEQYLYTVRWLLQKNIYYDEGLSFAISKGYSEIALLLVNYHITHPSAGRGWDFLRLAAKNGRLEIVRLLLESKRLNPSFSQEALEMAAENGHIEIVHLLLDHAKDKTIAFYRAVQGNHIEIVRLLLKYSPKIDIFRDILLMAAEHLNEKMICLLLENGVPVRWGGNRAFAHAAFHGHIGIVKLLLDHKADVHYDDDETLKIAARKNRFEIVKVLLDYKANVHAGNEYALKWGSWK